MTEDIQTPNEMHCYPDNLTDCNKIIWKMWLAHVRFPPVFCNFRGLIKQREVVSPNLEPET